MPHQSAAVSTSATAAALQEIFWCYGFTGRATYVLVCVGEVGGLQLCFCLVPRIELDVKSALGAVLNHIFQILFIKKNGSGLLCGVNQSTVNGQDDWENTFENMHLI